MAELKPCPFCGNRTAPEVISIAELDSVEGNEWYDSHFTVVCSMYDGGCGASVRCNNESREEAAEAWNARYLTEYVVKMPEPPKEDEA